MLKRIWNVIHKTAKHIKDLLMVGLVSDTTLDILSRLSENIH